MYEQVFQAISKLTGEILAESWTLVALEERYAEHGHWVFLRDTRRGLEWDIPETDYQDD